MYAKIGDRAYELDTSFSTALRYRCFGGLSIFAPELNRRGGVLLLWAALKNHGLSVDEVEQAYATDERLRLSAVLLHLELLRPDSSVSDGAGGRAKDSDFDELTILALCVTYGIGAALLRTLTLYQVIGLLHACAKLKGGGKPETTREEFQNFYSISASNEAQIDAYYASGGGSNG